MSPLSRRVGDGNDLDVNTFSGDVRLRLPDSANGKIDFNSFSGRFESDLPVTLNSSATVDGRRLGSSCSIRRRRWPRITGPACRAPVATPSSSRSWDRRSKRRRVAVLARADDRRETGDAARVERLMKEADELTAIFVASLKTAKR